MGILKWLAIGVVVVVLAVALAGQLGLLRGRMPNDLGARDGRLKPPSMTPNSVTSQAALYPEHPMRDYARVEPIALQGSGPQTIERIRRVVEAMDGGKVVQVNSGYLYAQFTSRMLKFVDDVEFWSDPQAGVIHVRSASRLGRKDLGVNRARVEAIRARLAG
jgi:uncharacterized protein (DUF1499 family)